MATGTLTPWPRYTVLNAAGKPISGALLNTYIAGTSTPAPTYTDVALTVPNANPIVANSMGQIGPVYLAPGSSYKYVFTNPDGSALFTQDNISSVPGTAAGVDIIGTAGEALTAGQAVYLSDGSGGKTAGLWYKADSANTYSSTTPEVGIVPASISAASAGTIRKDGIVTGMTSLTVGAVYYIGTGGAITTTAPVNARKIGQADTTSSIVVGFIPSPQLASNNIAQGRLTLTTAVPVTTADVTAATTLRYAPYGGNQIALYNGTVWAISIFAELSIAVPATTSQMYDVFVFDNSGTPALELLAWTNDTTRATALVTQDGVLVKTGALTRRYVGSFRTTTVSGQTEDSLAKRYVWNYYNRVRRPGRVTPTVDSYAYSTDTYRQANADTANQLDFVIGFAEVLLVAKVAALFSSGSADQFAIVSIGEDSTTTAVTGVVGQGGGSTATGVGATAPVQVCATLEKYPAVGRHTYVWLERAGGGGTVTWYGDNGNSAKWQGGISGFIDG